MNIFVFDLDHKTNAYQYCDKHLVKMITEHTQLLSGACRIAGEDCGYRLTHKNHPCAIWVRESLDNWFWLYQLNRALHQEYRERYNTNKKHKAFEIMENLVTPSKLPSLGLTNFAQAMPVEYKSASVTEAYRAYFNGEKQHIAQWKHGEIPHWFVKA